MTAWKTTPVLVSAAIFAITANQIVGAQLSTAGRLRLELFVNDVPKSTAFYRDVLGFAVVREEKGYTSMRLGTVEFGFGALDGLSKGHYFRPEIATQRPGLGTEIVIEANDVQNAYERVKRSGHAIVTPLGKRPWGPTDFRLADPDGYYLRVSSHS